MGKFFILIAALKITICAQPLARFLSNVIDILQSTPSIHSILISNPDFAAKVNKAIFFVTSIEDVFTDCVIIRKNVKLYTDLHTTFQFVIFD